MKIEVEGPRRPPLKVVATPRQLRDTAPFGISLWIGPDNTVYMFIVEDDTQLLIRCSDETIFHKDVCSECVEVDEDDNVFPLEMAGTGYTVKFIS